MHLYYTQCCAVNEIGNLSNHKTPNDAMLDFCRLTLGGQSKHPSVTTKGKVGAFYTFTGVVGTTAPENCLKGYTYGPAFKEFIEKNELGPVIQSEERVNIIGSPTHIVRVWVWAPDAERLAKWYELNKDTKEAAL